MIKSFTSKALQQFWKTGRARRLPVRNQDKVQILLDALHRSGKPEDMNLPGFKFHGLHGNPKRWSVWVTGNYRITWAWDEGAVDVDIEDYH